METKKLLSSALTLAVVANLAVTGIAMADTATGSAEIASGVDAVGLEDNNWLNSGTLDFFLDGGSAGCQDAGNLAFDRDAQTACAQFEYFIEGYDTNSADNHIVSMNFQSTSTGYFTDGVSDIDDIPFEGGALTASSSGAGVNGTIQTVYAGALTDYGALGEFSTISIFSDNTTTVPFATFVESGTNADKSWYTYSDLVNLFLTIPAGQPAGTFSGVTLTISMS